MTTNIDAPNTKFPTGFSHARRVFVLPNGQILALGGDVYNLGSARLEAQVITRYNADGSLDETFGQGGKLVGRGPSGLSGAVAADGSFLIGGDLDTTGLPPPEFYSTAAAIRRFLPNGTVDTSFGGLDPGAHEPGYVMAAAADIKLLPDGKFIVSDGFNRAGRFNADGSPDSTFGPCGWQSVSPTQFGGAAVAAQSDGKVLLAGGNTLGFVLARFSALSEYPPTYNDVGPSDYFADAVAELSCRGAISGYDDGSFRPYNVVTRGQLIKILLIAQRSYLFSYADQDFSDVAADNPFYAYIRSAAIRGIISGYADGTFRPNNPVTRGQLAKIVVKALGWTEDVSGGPRFNDVSSDNPFYASIETAYHHGLLAGYGDGSFRWQAATTRGQAAKIIALAVNYVSLPQK